MADLVVGADGTLTVLVASGEGIVGSHSWRPMMLAHWESYAGGSRMVLEVREHQVTPELLVNLVEGAEFAAACGFKLFLE